MLGSIHRFLRRVQRNEDGMIFVEAGLVMSLLILFLILVYDVGNLFVRQMQITNALRAGTQYALVRKPVAGDVSQISNAVRNAAPDYTTPPTVNSTVYCLCADGTQVSCTSVCADGSDREAFVTVTYQESYKMFLKYPGMGQNITLGGEATVRLN